MIAKILMVIQYIASMVVRHIRWITLLGVKSFILKANNDTILILTSFFLIYVLIHHRHNRSN